MKILIIATLIGIVVSLGQAMFHMSSANGNSTKTARALTVRITLSVALFVFLLTGWYFGLLQPHHLR